MALYRIHITLPDGSHDSFTGLFADGLEALAQTRADFPTAQRVQVHFIRVQA